MRVRVVAVGKLKERAFRELADLYLKRIQRFIEIQETEIKSSAGFARHVSDSDRVIALEVLGKQRTSTDFAAGLERWGATGKGNVTFLIGGADGIPRDVSARASEALSLSTMTLPHRLARVVLYEQLYRGFSILRGEPYAREG